MADADRLAIEGGVPGLTLMENAGRAVAEEVSRRFPDAGLVAVLCGPGNNGGDGFVAARHLRERGYALRLGLAGEVSRLPADAAIMAKSWAGEIEPLAPALLAGADVVVDALFGAGLARPIEGELGRLIEAVNASGIPVIAVDVPSGIDGTTGAVRGVAIRATATVTFFRLKPGHLLLPGRTHCGETILADIGIPDRVLETIKPRTFANEPGLWLPHFPWPKPEGHKYGRGHAVVVSGPAASTGAARLGARGALRAGAGLVTVASPKDALAINAAQLTAIMVRLCDDADELTTLLADERKNAVMLGPGAGVGEHTRAMALAALRSKAAVVLDADALTSFADDPGTLFAAIRGRGLPSCSRRMMASSRVCSGIAAGCPNWMPRGTRHHAEAPPSCSKVLTPSSLHQTAGPRSTPPRAHGSRPPAPATCSQAWSQACLHKGWRRLREQVPPFGCMAPRRRPSAPG